MAAVAEVARWLAVNASVAAILRRQARAPLTPECGGIDDPCQCNRRRPGAALRNELSACVSDLLITVRLRKHRGQRRFSSCKLLLAKPDDINAPRTIERKHTERRANHGNRLAAKDLDHDLGGAHPLTRKLRQAIACRKLEHSIECRVRHAVDRVVRGDEEPLA
jgi:hypothetical protein